MVDFNDDKDVLARTLYGEAANSNVADAEAIACVIMNRVAYKNWPNTAREVCLQPWQFSCWNAKDPQRAKIMKVTTGKWYLKCREIAAAALNGTLVDKTQKSTHYYATYIKKPKWANGKTPVYKTDNPNGSHLFFNDIDTKKPTLKTSATKQGAAVVATGATVLPFVSPEVVNFAQEHGAAIVTGATPVIGTIATTAQENPQGFALLFIVLCFLMLGVGGFFWWQRNRSYKKDSV